MSGRRLHAIVAVVLAGLWGGALAMPHLQGDASFLDRIEATVADLRSLVRGIRKPPSSVLIVAVDDEFVAQEGKYPVSRGTLARIIDTVGRFSPKAVALDMLLLDPSYEADDAALADALARNRSVIAGAAVFSADSQRLGSAGDGALSRVPIADRLALPLDHFAEAAAVGLVNVATDFGGTPRLAPMIFRTSDRIEASFPLQTASVAMGLKPVFETGRVVLGEHRVPTDLGQRLPISYYGPRGTIETVGVAALLGGKVRREQVQDRIVVIGATVIGSGDVFPTPFDPVLPGVEVISTAISHLVNGDGLVRDGRTRRADAAVAIVLPMILVALLAWRRSVPGFVAIATVLALWLAANFFFFAQGVWFSAALPLAAAIPPVIVFGATQLWIDRRRAYLYAAQNQVLQRFQAPALRDWLAHDPGFLAEPVRQEAAIVFIDLSGFTAFSEVASASAMREMLDDFYRLVEEDVQAHKGVITSFMGDGAMIVFGLPQPTPDDPVNALTCATALAAHANSWLAAQPASLARRIGIKLGAHCGSIVASRLGGGRQQQITATGDTVNVASRLMEVAAQNGAGVALSGDLYRAAGQALPASGLLLGPVQSPIRGRSGTMTVWLWRDTPAGQ